MRTIVSKSYIDFFFSLNIGISTFVAEIDLL